MSFNNLFLYKLIMHYYSGRKLGKYEISQQPYNLRNKAIHADTPHTELGRQNHEYILTKIIKYVPDSILHQPSHKFKEQLKQWLQANPNTYWCIDVYKT
jgi:hypothetical protein